MTLDYFYGTQADQFTFYRIPKVLFTDERFKPISAEAKILYGILLDWMSLSRKNGWLDDSNRVFIIYTLEEVMDAIGCADQKATNGHKGTQMLVTPAGKQVFLAERAEIIG